jgi:nitrite reductase/ring-hydroxylating ferredoxin subunit
VADFKSSDSDREHAFEPSKPTTRSTRRHVLLGAGVIGAGAGAALVLSACGAKAGDDPYVHSTGGGSPDLGSTADIPVGGGKIFGEQNVVVTQPTSDQFKAFTATCTHQGCQVSKVTGGMIQCMCHGSEFNITDGSVMQGPATKSLAQKTITVANGQITLT